LVALFQATLIVMQWGQFLDHDITLTPESEETESCCTAAAIRGTFAGECFPINFPCGDPTFGNLPPSSEVRINS
jgi:peroxidase